MTGFQCQASTHSHSLHNVQLCFSATIPKTKQRRSFLETECVFSVENQRRLRVQLSVGADETELAVNVEYRYCLRVVVRVLGFTLGLGVDLHPAESIMPDCGPNLPRYRSMVISHAVCMRTTIYLGREAQERRVDIITLESR
jgi:hypothetical protein